MTKDSEITKIQVVIRRFLWETRNVVKTPEESQKWLSKFRNTLEFQDLEELPSEYAMLLLAEAKSFNNTKKRNAQMKWVRDSLVREGIKRPTQDQLDERWLEMYGNEENSQDAPNGNAGVDRKSATSCDQITADGDIREDSQAKPDGSAITRNETRAHDALEPSANLYATRQAKNGDAATREGADESATVSNHFALDMPGPRKDRQTAKTRDSRGSGRYQPPSLGPEDGNLFTTKNPSTISANGRRTGGSVREAVDPLPPVRQSEPDVMSLAYSGEFGNVRLTQEQYGELGIKFGNQQKLNRAIDSLSCKLENDEMKPAPRSHYAVLVKWANYRDDMDEKKEMEDANRPPRYETVSEHNARVSRQADEWIREHFGKKEKRNG